MLVRRTMAQFRSHSVQIMMQSCQNVYLKTCFAIFKWSCFLSISSGFEYNFFLEFLNFSCDVFSVCENFSARQVVVESKVRLFWSKTSSGGSRKGIAWVCWSCHFRFNYFLYDSLLRRGFCINNEWKWLDNRPGFKAANSTGQVFFN